MGPPTRLDVVEVRQAQPLGTGHQGRRGQPRPHGGGGAVGGAQVVRGGQRVGVGVGSGIVFVVTVVAVRRCIPVVRAFVPRPAVRRVFQQYGGGGRAAIIQRARNGGRAGGGSVAPVAHAAVLAPTVRQRAGHTGGHRHLARPTPPSAPKQGLVGPQKHAAPPRVRGGQRVPRRRQGRRHHGRPQADDLQGDAGRDVQNPDPPRQAGGQQPAAVGRPGQVGHAVGRVRD